VPLATSTPNIFSQSPTIKAMRIEFIAIGSELLNAGRVDSNSIWIAERLAELGLGLSLKACVGDDHDALRPYISNALIRSDLIITTGGLGPTFDDRTKEIFAEAVGVPLVEDAQSRLHVDSFFRSLGRNAPECNYKQALIPEGAIALHNAMGTAPGVFWKCPPPFAHCSIAMLPGVPREMMALWAKDIQPRILGFAKTAYRTLRIVASGAGESALDERTKGIRDKYAHLDWTILAPRTHVEFLLRSKDDAALDAARLDMEAALGEDLVCCGLGSPESVLLDLLATRDETLALAESVTGGILASRLAGVPGASKVFLGGAVAYSAKSKTELLGLHADFIAAHGTVGEATSLEMAALIKERLDATWGLAITGNAGPTIDKNVLNQNGNDQVGRCYIAVAGPEGAECQARSIHGDRQDIQFRAANWALDMLRRAILRLSVPKE
jgi:nicotinamide-nucleotide amidase